MFTKTSLRECRLDQFLRSDFLPQLLALKEMFPPLAPFFPQVLQLRLDTEAEKRFMGGLWCRGRFGHQTRYSEPDVVAGNLDVEFNTRQSGNVSPLTLKAFRVRQSVSCRIDLLGLLLDVIKKADE